MFEYHAGDRVIVKRRLSTFRFYPMHYNPVHPGFFASEALHKPFCGKQVTISKCCSCPDGEPGWYEIDEAPGVCWTDDMFLKKVK